MKLYALCRCYEGRIQRPEFSGHLPLLKTIMEAEFKLQCDILDNCGINYDCLAKDEYFWIHCAGREFVWEIFSYDVEVT